MYYLQPTPPSIVANTEKSYRVVRKHFNCTVECHTSTSKSIFTHPTSLAIYIYPFDSNLKNELERPVVTTTTTKKFDRQKDDYYYWGQSINHQVLVTRGAGIYGELARLTLRLQVLGNRQTTHVCILSLAFFSFPFFFFFFRCLWTFMCPRVFLIKVWCPSKQVWYVGGVQKIMTTWSTECKSIAFSTMLCPPFHCAWIIRECKPVFVMWMFAFNCCVRVSYAPSIPTWYYLITKDFP